jgi:hypothetical protein
MYPDGRGMSFDTDEQTFVFDIGRVRQPAANQKFREETVLAGVRGSIFSAIFTRKQVTPAGPISEASWVAHVRLPVTFEPRTGDRIINVRVARTGRAGRWETLRIVFVQQMGERDYHLWLKEDVVK